MEFAGHSGSPSAKETDDVEGAISKKTKCPRDVDVRSSPISKKAKCPGDVGDPSLNVANRIAAVQDAAFAAILAYNRSRVTLLAEYLELLYNTKKHLQEMESEIQSDKDEISRTERFLVEIESKIKGTCRLLSDRNLVRVCTVPEVEAVHYLVSNRFWVGKALICVDEEEEVGSELMAAAEKLIHLNIPHLKIPHLNCVADSVKKNCVRTMGSNVWKKILCGEYSVKKNCVRTIGNGLNCVKKKYVPTMGGSDPMV